MLRMFRVFGDDAVEDRGHQYCDELSETAWVTGAVNTVYPRGEGARR